MIHYYQNLENLNFYREYLGRVQVHSGCGWKTVKRFVPADLAHYPFIPVKKGSVHE